MWALPPAHAAGKPLGCLCAPSTAAKRYDETAESAAEQPADQGWLDKVLSGSGSTVALAFLCNKALFPVRTPITIGLTPMVARLLRSRAAKMPAP